MLNRQNNCFWVHTVPAHSFKSVDSPISCLRGRKVSSYRPVDLLKFFNVFMWVRCQHRFIQEALCIGQWTSIHLQNKQTRKKIRLRSLTIKMLSWTSLSRIEFSAKLQNLQCNAHYRGHPTNFHIWQLRVNSHARVFNLQLCELCKKESLLIKF